MSRAGRSRWSPPKLLHPDFAYRPETGEEKLHAFLGVPLIRSARVLGVLVLQNKVPRIYTDEEIGAALAVAGLLAEIAASGELLGKEETATVSEVLRLLIGFRERQWSPALPMAALRSTTPLSPTTRVSPRTRPLNSSGWRMASKASESQLTTCWLTSASPGFPGKCSKPTASSPTIAAGRSGCAPTYSRASQPRLRSSG